MIPEGKYTARATGAYDFGHTEAGNEQVGVAFKITEGPHAGTVLTWYGYFNTEDNIRRTMKALRVCGWTGDDVTRLEGITANEVTVVVEVNEFNGRRTPRIAFVQSAAVAMKSVMREQQKQSLAERMRGYAVASRAPAMGRPALTASPTGPRDGTLGTQPDVDREIPF